MSRLIFVARPYLELIALGAFERHARSPAVTRGTQSKSDAVLRRSLARDNHSLAIAQHQRMSSGEAMPIHRLLKNSAFGPDDIKVLTDAFEAALRELNLVDRADPATELVAKRIIELAQRGERDHERLCQAGVKGTSSSPLR